MKQFNLERRCRRRSRRPPVYKPANGYRPDVMPGLNQEHRRDEAGLTGRDRRSIRTLFAGIHRTFARHQMDVSLFKPDRSVTPSRSSAVPSSATELGNPG